MDDALCMSVPDKIVLIENINIKWNTQNHVDRLFVTSVFCVWSNASMSSHMTFELKDGEDLTQT